MMLGISSMKALRGAPLCISIVALLLAVSGQNVSSQRIENISPTSTDNPFANSSSGGRVNNIAMDPNDPNTLYAASEWGGVFRSTDRGQTWYHVPAHEPQSTWDVAVSSTGTIYVSSLYDGRTQANTGIQVSTDRGETWTHPDDFDHPGPLWCNDKNFTNEVSGYGISIDPANPNHVAVATNCGIAETRDGGRNWAWSKPNSATPDADLYWDVVIHNGGIVDVCGRFGFFRRPAPPPAGTGPAPGFVASPGLLAVAGVPVGGVPGLAIGLLRCSLAVSPFNANNVFVGTFAGVFETPDGGATWPAAGIYASPEPIPQGRVVNVATNSLGGNQFDLWFGDVSLWRITCLANPGGGPSCNPGPVAAAWTNVTLNAATITTTGAGAHADAGGLLFDNSVSGAVACPIAYANDGGININTVALAPACQTPVWAKPARSTTALWVDDLSGVESEETEKEELFIGLQDNGQFVTEFGGSRTITGWTSSEVGDAPEVNATSNISVTTTGLFSPPRNPMTGVPVIPPNYRTCPPCVCPVPPGGQCIDNTAATALATCWDVPDPTQPVGVAPNVLNAGNFRGFQLKLQTPNSTLPSTDTFISGGFTSQFLSCSGYPPGQIQTSRATDTYLREDSPLNSLVVATSRGIFSTGNIRRTPSPVWLALGRNQPTMPCDLKIGRGYNKSYYVRGNFFAGPRLRPDGPCTALAVGELFRLRRGVRDVRPGSWELVTTGNMALPAGTSAFGTYAVDPNNADTIIAVDHAFNPPQIMMTENGGTSWRRLDELENLMTVGGQIKFVVNGAGPRPGDEVGRSYVQPSVFAFDPEDSQIIVAGGFNSGLFISTDRGQTWHVLSDPTNVTPLRPNIGHPLHIHFERDDGVYNIYVGTRGRGVWRITPGIRVRVRLNTLTAVSADGEEQPILGVTFSTRDGSRASANPADAFLRLETRNTADRLGDVRQGGTLTIPQSVGEYEVTFMPFCIEGSDDYRYLPSRIFVAAQGWERGWNTRGADRETNFTNWENSFRTRLQRDIDRNQDSTNLAEIAERAWVRYRWFDTDDYIGADVAVFDRAFIENLARGPINSANIALTLPTPGPEAIHYMITGTIWANGIPICK